MHVELDFEIDDELVDLYVGSLNNQYTREQRNQDLILTRDEASRRLYMIGKTKGRYGMTLLGILKLIDDNGKLIGLSFPRMLRPDEYATFDLNPIIDYYRLSGIYLSDQARGKGAGKFVACWFKNQYQHVVWTTHASNTPSIRTAKSAGLHHHLDLFLNKNGEMVKDSTDDDVVLINVWIS